MNRIERAQAEAETPLWARILVPALVVVAIVVAFAGAWYARSGNDASQDVRESSQRADCREQYRADFTEVIRARDDLKLDLDAQYYAATYESAVTGQRPTAAQIERFGATLGELEGARAAVRALPKLDDAVNHGYELDGVQHPPCPG
jgi:hypothetical protein